MEPHSTRLAQFLLGRSPIVNGVQMRACRHDVLHSLNRSHWPVFSLKLRPTSIANLERYCSHLEVPHRSPHPVGPSVPHARSASFGFDEVHFDLAFADEPFDALGASGVVGAFLGVLEYVSFLGRRPDVPHA